MELFDKGYKAGATEMLSYIKGFVNGCLKRPSEDNNECLQWLLEVIEEKLKEVDEK